MTSRAENFNVKESLPNVLVLGNGILTSCAKCNGIENYSWKDCIAKLSTDCRKDDAIVKADGIPYSVKATLIASTEDTARRESYRDTFKTIKFDDHELLKKLINAGFDAILTTNYTYEIENCFHRGYSELKSKEKYAKTIARKYLGARTDSRYLLHTYNKFKNSPQIWHIHGEERRPTSIILTHDEYSRLIAQLVIENKQNGNKYVEYENDVHYKSWLDYFLMSNLYIVGLGMDFSEFDLWWVLNRRVREKAQIGKIVFFAPADIKAEIKMALERMTVTVESFEELPIPQKLSDEYFLAFYKKSIEYINNDLRRKNK